MIIWVGINILNLNIKNKIALVTGAGRGIGEDIVKKLAEEGVLVICVSKTKSNLVLLKKKIDEINKNNNFILPLNLSNKNSCGLILKFLKKNKLYPDIVINNVGGNLGITDPLANSKLWKRVFDLNLFLAIDLNKSLLKNMIKKKFGRIVHISSISALENQGPPSYCASKAALNAYVRSVGRYVSEHNVMMTSVMPGAIMTSGGYWDKKLNTNPNHVKKYLSERMAIKRFGKVDEISKFVAFLCSDHASFCAGSNFLIDGGQGKLFQEV
jgi:3-oxoacyl-[acyl-carrier protein] reductase